MSGNRNQRALLMEIMIAVLFFGLCATVLLQTFAAAREYSRRAGAEGEALIAAQDMSERLYAAEAPEEMLAADGYVFEDGAWKKSGADYALEVVCEIEPLPAGEMLRAEVRAIFDGEALFEIPCARYTAKEAAE